MRRLLRPRPTKEIAPNSTVDPGEVQDTEALIEFVGACRAYASELAVNELTTRTWSELEQYLDTTTTALVENLRNAGPADRRSASRSSTPPCASAPRCSGRNMPRCWSRRAMPAAGGERKLAAKA